MKMALAPWAEEAAPDGCAHLPLDMHLAPSCIPLFLAHWGRITLAHFASRPLTMACADVGASGGYVVAACKQTSMGAPMGGAQGV